jgi:diaminopimelate epimerase
MAALTLTKHHGLGNDFLVVFDLDLADPAALARMLCDRRTGIGADGLLIGSSAPGYAARMQLINADGSPAEMSGNGIRCFAQALFRRGTGSELQILTDAGARAVEVSLPAEGDTILAAVDMGEIEPLDEPADWHRLGCDPMRPVMHLSVGNPHSVVGVEDVAEVDLATLGAVVPTVNLEVIEPGPEMSAVTMRVHERGAGLTMACGTGACASAWAAVQWGLVPAHVPEIVVHMPGGDATVKVNHPAKGRVTLVGPATFVATITIDVP